MIVKIYPENPNTRDVERVAGRLEDGGIAIIPTDTLYAFACSMKYKKSVETIARLKGFKLKQAKYSMLCADLSMVSEYTRPINKDVFQMLKRCLPGPFTFIMEANNNVPRNYQNANKTIGMRVPDNAICHAIVERLGCPLVATSVRRIPPDEETGYVTDPGLIDELFSNQVDIVVDGGMGSDEPSTVVDCSAGQIEIIRQGKGTLD
ncbi:MAG: L-threonylcarbamoyladenylate synthase [Bacteroidales bacterium]|nr:L-threonylcarbamoyladenylate synthase [Bacteroidales bacterium]